MKRAKHLSCVKYGQIRQNDGQIAEFVRCKFDGQMYNKLKNYGKIERGI